MLSAGHVDLLSFSQNRQTIFLIARLERQLQGRPGDFQGYFYCFCWSIIYALENRSLRSSTVYHVEGYLVDVIETGSQDGLLETTASMTTYPQSATYARNRIRNSEILVLSFTPMHLIEQTLMFASRLQTKR